jgi:nicotinamide-nucleotide amidase
MNMCDEMIERIKEYGVGKYMYSIDIPTLEETLVRTLAKNGLTFTCAESCTGGLISKRITDVSGASAVFPGGICSYANEIKAGVLGVKTETLDKYTAVSEQTAREMADGIRRVMGTDISVSVTGYAGPGGGTEQDPVGTVYVGVSSNAGTFVKRLSYSSLRDRVFIRRAASSFAMGLALSVIGIGEFDIR